MLLAVTAFVLGAVATAPMMLGLGVHVLENRQDAASLALVRTVPVGDLRVGDRIVSTAPAGYRAEQVVGFQPGSYGVQDVALASAAVVAPAWLATSENPTAERVLVSSSTPTLRVLVGLAVLVLAAGAGSVLSRRLLSRQRLVRDTPRAG